MPANPSGTPTSRSGLWQFFRRSGQYNVATSAGPTVPTDGTAGFDPGCLYVNTDSTTPLSDGLYQNTGTGASCNFDPLALEVLTDLGRFTGGGATAPADGTVGWAVNALFIQTTGTTSSDRHFVNVGGPVTSNFNALTLTIASD